MRVLPMLAALVAALFLCAPLYAQDSVTDIPAPDGKPGVEDETCWEGGGKKIKMDVDATTMGDTHNKATDLDSNEESNKAPGDPDPDGGTARSDTMFVGDDSYRIRTKNGKARVEYKDGDSWKPMTKKECPKKKKESASSSDVIGSLPDEDDETISWVGPGALRLLPHYCHDGPDPYLYDWGKWGPIPGPVPDVIAAIMC